MKTQDEARREFSDLYEDMRAENAKDGGSFSKRTLWEQFIAHGIEYERFPAACGGFAVRGYDAPRSSVPLVQHPSKKDSII